MTTFECSRCGTQKPVQTAGGTGYAVDRDGLKVCYLCCAIDDQMSMRTEGRAVLYLVRQGTAWRVTNWPATLQLRPLRVKTSGHNMTERLDVWFAFGGRVWHGVNLGNNDILRCRQTKQAAPSSAH